ncbi:MAG: aminoacetone oxidase family FAD-binding enzyme [Mogibacterium sp.]|nr:aminoacetone oxidase family FAD-binding enzyme [Mogibacterium sp.]
MNRTYYDVAIIGGGASGLMLAARLNLNGSRGIILEGSARLGSKLLMSGGGHCNITHAGSIKDFVKAYGEAGPSLRKCLYRHSNEEIVNWLEGLGVPLVDKNGRVFPASMKAADVLSAFIKKATTNQWHIETNAFVNELKPICDDATFKGYEINLIDRAGISARNIVIATGGITYPETGSDGSFFHVLESLGVRVTELHAALAPVFVKAYPYTELSGLSVQGVTVNVLDDIDAETKMKKSKGMTGDILFTHKGFSGPVVLNISKYVKPGKRLLINYNKALSELPKRMQSILTERAKGPSGDVRTKVLSSLLSGDEFIVSKVDSRGMVTAGGVSLDQIDMRTMQLKNSPSDRTNALYIIGEALDIDGITGGYNLQMCFSTAATAADYLLSIIQHNQ